MEPAAAVGGDRTGWIVAEYGCQPWATEAVRPTAPGVSSLSASQLISRRSVAGVIASSMTVGGTITSAGFALFPFLLPSSLPRALQRDPLGCVLQPWHPASDTDCHGDLHADHHPLHLVDLSGAAGWVTLKEI